MLFNNDSQNESVNLDFTTYPEDIFFMDIYPKLPGVIIIDITDVLNHLRTEYQKYQLMMVEEYMVISDLVDLLIYEAQAESNLLLSTQEIYDQSSLEQGDENDQLSNKELIEYLQTRLEIGKQLFYIFLSYNLYRGGLLCYEFKKIDQQSLYLEKLYVPTIDDQVRKNRMARDPSFASRSATESVSSPVSSAHFLKRNLEELVRCFGQPHSGEYWG